MKSFDEMADDFVILEIKNARPYVLRDHERARLRRAYMTGLNAGIEFGVDSIKPIGEEEKGL